jgi:hypothetical protein
MGYWACTHCLHKIDDIHLKNCKKVVSMGHRRFLPEKNPLRKKAMHWKGKADHRTKPTHFRGDEIFEMVKDLRVVFGKGDGSELFQMMLTGIHQCERRNLYFGCYLIGKALV